MQASQTTQAQVHVPVPQDSTIPALPTFPAQPVLQTVTPVQALRALSVIQITIFINLVHRVL